MSSTPDPIIKVTIDGQNYTLRPKELNAWQNATFEAETGISVEEMVGRFAGGGRTLVTIAQFVYLCLIQNGQTSTSTTFQRVAERLTYGSDVSEVEYEGLDLEGEEDEGPVGLDPDGDREELLERRREIDEALAAAGPDPGPADPTSAASGSPTVEGSSSLDSDET